MRQGIIVNGTKPDLFVVDELDYLKEYNKEQLEELLESIKPKINEAAKALRKAAEEYGTNK